MLNSKAIDPDFKDVLDSLKKDIFISMNCHAIGRVEKFNSINQTCEVSIIYSKKYNTRNSDGTYSSELVDYPLLVDCPAIILTGSSAGLTMPIKKGDECLLLFNDRDIDNWFIGAKAGELATSRLHSLSDALVLVGLRATGKEIDSYDPDNPVLFNGETRITVKENKIKLENAIESLNTILQDLITTIKTQKTIPAVVGVQLTLDPPVVVALEVIATRLGGLIE